MRNDVFRKRGLAGLQVWLMIFGFVGIAFMMGVVSSADGDDSSSQDGDSGAAYLEYLGTISGATSNIKNPTGSGMGDLSEIKEKIEEETLTDIVRSDTLVTNKALTIAGTDVAIPAGTEIAVDANGAGTYRLNGGLKSLTKDQISDAQNKGLIGKPTSQNKLSNFLGLEAGSGWDALATGVQWAVVAYGAGSMLGSILGFSDENTQALSTAFAAGAFAYQGFRTWDVTSNTPFASGWVGFGVGVVVFALMYKDTETKVVTFECLPWQAPNGGNDCEVCNDDDLECSEYRCRSLGQSCELVNEGTLDEKCVYVNPYDVEPPVIKPNYYELTSGYQYTNVQSSPPSPGFEIVNLEGGDGCIEAFTPLEFGVTTDEPAQCKIDYNSTGSFDDMVAYFGGSNLYLYNHSEVISLPGASEMMGSGFSLVNGKDFSFFVRCQDKNGNVNQAEYEVRFCVDPSPDTTAPRIEATSVLNGGCVAEDTDEAEVVFYVNEPSTCKWSFTDQDYDLMENPMGCSVSASNINSLQLFGCTSILTGIPRDGTNYYVRCKDQPGEADEDRNENSESFEFSLRGSTSLVLNNLQPNGTIYGGVSPAPIELYAETYYGCNEGLAICSWSSDGNNFVQFYDTNNIDGIHTQRLDLTDGEHEYTIRCVDAGGNLAEEVVTVDVEIDTDAPVVARVYEESGMLKIVTVRDSECSYSLDDCDFTFSEGVEMPYGNTTVHVAEWENDNTYYIKCRDEFLNEGADCAVVVRPTSNFL